MIVNLLGIGSKNTKIKARFCFVDDPGYRDTARMLAETGLAFIFNKDKITVGGGFWTPSSCMGDILFERLLKTGCLFSFV